MDSRQRKRLRLRGSCFATPRLALRQPCLFCGRGSGFATPRFTSRQRIWICDRGPYVAAGNFTSRQGIWLRDIQNDIAAGNLELRQRKERRRTFSVDAAAPGAAPRAGAAARSPDAPLLLAKVENCFSIRSSPHSGQLSPSAPCPRRWRISKRWSQAWQRYS